VPLVLARPVRLIKNCFVKTPQALPPRALRKDLTPFFHNELDRCFGPNATDLAVSSAPDLPKNLLIDSWHLGASDIHFEPSRDGARIRLRVDGMVWDVAQLNDDRAKVFLNQFKAMAGIDPVVRFTPADASATFAMVDGHLDLRLALAPTSSGETMAVRLLDAKRLERSILELGLSEQNLRRLRAWLKQTSGMVLMAGPTGCGKTTTAYSLLHELKTANRVIISVEDPVECQIDGITQIQVNGLKELSFSEGVKAILRHDPDYLMVGEIRDALSAQAAVRAAIAGRVLLSTVHCRDAVSAVTALRNWNLTDREIADALSVVVAQRLVRKLCRHCRKSAKPSKLEAAWIRSFNLSVPPKVWTPVGCKECKSLGYRGRTGVFEVWRLDEDARAAILKGTDELLLREHLARRKHLFLVQDGLAKLSDGTTSFDEIKRIAGDVDLLATPASRRKPSSARTFSSAKASRR